ncbi:CopD family protein [Nocardioides humi]|uniref:Copper resistance protein CopC n=1 Tax=Nocardioides humi TaxID=449461 RepID=A0ABN2BZ57_9ACTN|nr:CopD family protein [Nocardioides humi]
MTGSARALLAGVVLVLVLWPQAAAAHARTVGTTPADGQVLAEAPASLTVTFDEPVSLAPEGNRLLTAAGEEVPADFSVRDHVLTIEPRQPLGRGTQVVTWRVVSTDSHPVAGSFTFSVGAPSATVLDLPVGTEEREVRLAQAIANGMQYAGTLGLAGLAGVVVLVAPAGVRRHAGLVLAWRRAALVFAGLAAGGAVLLAPLTALWESGRSLGAVLSGDTWTAAVRSASGAGALLVAVGAAAAVLGIRRGRDALAVGGAAAALAALAVVGHTRSYGPSWVVLPAELVHLAAAAFWWGGLVALVLALAARPGLRVGVRAELLARFSGAAVVVVAALVVAGGVLYWRIGHSLSGLWDTSYGRAVLLKSALLLPVLALAAWNRLRLVDRAAGRDAARAATMLRRTIGAEALVVAAVVAVTAVLVNLTPPARAPRAAAAAPAEQRLELALGDAHRATVVVAPVRRGVNGVRVTVTDAEGAVVGLDDVPALSFRLPEADVGPLRRPVSPTASGVWEATVDLALPGTWEVSLAVPLSRFAQPVVTGRIEVP